MHVGQEAIHAEGRRAGEDVLAGRDQCPQREFDQLVGSGAQDDPLDRCADVGGNGAPQPGLGRIGVDGVVSLGDGLADGREHAEGVLIGVEFEHVGGVDAEPGRDGIDGFDRDIRGQVEEVRAQGRRCAAVERHGLSFSDLRDAVQASGRGR